MDEAIKQIGERLKGLREVLDIPAQEVADLCGVPLDVYVRMEEGDGELSVSSLRKISRKYGIALDVLLFGEGPRMSSYFLTRNGQGMSVERRKAYKYQSLAGGFRGARLIRSWCLWSLSLTGRPLKRTRIRDRSLTW